MSLNIYIEEDFYQNFFGYKKKCILEKIKFIYCLKSLEDIRQNVTFKNIKNYVYSNINNSNDENNKVLSKHKDNKQNKLKVGSHFLIVRHNKTLINN